MQTRIRFEPPAVFARTGWMFAWNVRFETLCAWLTRRPKTVPLPQMSQPLAIVVVSRLGNEASARSSPDSMAGGGNAGPRFIPKNEAGDKADPQTGEEGAECGRFRARNPVDAPVDSGGGLAESAAAAPLVSPEAPGEG